MAFSRKSKLEEQEVRQGENLVLRRFATANVAENPHDFMAEALDLVVNRQPDQSGSQAVGEKSTPAKWYSHFEEITANPISRDLRSVNDTLQKQWLAFNQYLDHEQQKKKEKSWKRGIFKKTPRATGPTWRVDTRTGQPLGIQDIITSVEDARTYWESRPRLADGKAQKAFHDFCDTVHSHSNLLKCLPEQNQYLSVFCGVTTTLIKASVNHQKTAEVLSQSLSDISEPLKDCEVEVEIMNTNDMHEAISFLYTHVFHFLDSAMKWYQACTSRRIFDSLTEDYSDILKDQVARIQHLCNRLIQKGEVKSHAEVRVMRLRQEDVAEKAALAAEKAATMAALTREEIREEMRKQGPSNAQLEQFAVTLGNRLLSGFQASLQAWLHQNDGKLSENPSLGFSARKLSERGHDTYTRRNSHNNKVAKITTRSELQQWAADLEDSTSSIIELLDIIDFSTALVGSEIAEAIRNWSRSATSQALWVMGRFQEIYPSDASAIAAKVIATARVTGIPFVCYFFNSEDETEGERPDSTTRPWQNSQYNKAIDFVYTLIRQLIDQLPSKVNLSRKRMKTRLGRLDGSLDTIGIALKILEELLDRGPAMLLIIIDGVEQVDESDSQPFILEVLLLLQQATVESAPGKAIKVLYTTAGKISDSLESLDEDYLESVEAEEGRKKHMRGRLKSLETLNSDSDATTISSPETLTDDGYVD